MSPFRKLPHRVGVISMHHRVENVSFIRGNSLCFSKGQMPWCFSESLLISSNKKRIHQKNPCIHPFKRWMLGKMDEKELEEGDFAWFCHGIHLLPCLPFPPFPPFPTSSIIFHLGVKMIGRLKATLAFPKLEKTMKKLCGPQAPVNKINRHGTCSIYRTFTGTFLQDFLWTFIPSSRCCH